MGPLESAGKQSPPVPVPNAADGRDGLAMSKARAGSEDRSVLTLTRRLSPFLLAGLLLVPQAAPTAASELGSFTASDLGQAAKNLVTISNQKRTARGLIALRLDPDLMAIAKTRADVMAANDVLSHTEPNGTSVFSRLSADGVHWYAAAEIIAYNTYPTLYGTVKAAIDSWMGSSGHRAIMLSTNYNYVGFGVAVAASGKRYFAGVYVKQRDETGAWTRMGSVSKTSLDATHVRVTIHWSGADTRLQVLTSGLRYFQLEARRTGHVWASWGLTTATRQGTTWTRGGSYDFRVRARDKAGNWGAWKTVHITL
jgi:uncharacterized protein YkwD